MLVVTYNIQWGRGRDGIVDLGRIAATVRAADVICLQEVERHWRVMPHADQVARLAELLPEHHAVYGAAIDVAAGPGDERASRLARRQLGLLTLARWPILATRTFPLAKNPVLGHVNEQGCLLESVIAPGGRPLRIYNTHLNYLSARQRLRQIEDILRIIEEAPRQGGPVTADGAPDSELGADWMALRRDELPAMPPSAVLAGDLNLGTGSCEYDRLVGPSDPGYGRLRDTTFLVDALSVAGLAESEGATWSGSAEDGSPRRIDHVLITADLVPLVRSGWIDAEADGSDHQPVFVELDWPG